MVFQCFGYRGDGNRKGYSNGIDDPHLINQLPSTPHYYLPPLIYANIYSVTVTVVEQKELRQRKIINLIIGDLERDIFPGTEIN